jgi:hypothetical protein
MPEDITTDTADVNLTEVAATIRNELKNEHKSGAALLHHALNASDALNLAHANRHKTNLSWKQWLRENCFVSVRTAFVRQQLARHRKEIEAEVQRVGDYLSIRAALRKIAKRTKKPADKPQPDVAAFLSIWKKIDHQTRVAVIDGIDVIDAGLLGVLSQRLRREIEGRVLNRHHNASPTNEKFNEQAAAALRQALSMQKTAKDRNRTAMGVASSLNMINNLLAKDGIDLNNVVGLVIDLQATVAKPTKKAA